MGHFVWFFRTGKSHTRVGIRTIRFDVVRVWPFERRRECARKDSSATRAAW